MEQLRSNRQENYPAAIRQVLRNELITDEQDVKRITSEVASYLATKQSRQAEEETWLEIERDIIIRDATAAEIRDRKALDDDY